MLGSFSELLCGLPIPRQEFDDTIVWMVGDAGEDVAEVGFRVDAVELGGFDERVHGGSSFAAAIGAGEEIIFPADGDAAQYSACGFSPSRAGPTRSPTARGSSSPNHSSERLLPSRQRTRSAPRN